MTRKSLFLWSIYLLLISFIMGGCTTMEKTASTTMEKYPNKPITVIVPSSAGAGIDLAARSLENTAPKYLGQPLVVMNKPGGGGVIGWNELVGANPDGYTIGISAIDMLLLPQYDAAKYNYPTALSPLVQFAALPMVIAVRADQPWQSLDDLIQYAKKHPGELKFGHAGVGTFAHLLGEMFGHAAGISIKQVPFTGGGEVTAALLGGHVQLIFVNPMIVKEHVKNGTLRVLALTGKQRMTDPVLSKIPTFKEQGLDIVLTTWYGIAVPKEMPPEIKNKLAEGFKAMVSDSEFAANMKKAGLQVEYLGPKESEAKWLSDSQNLTKTLQETGMLELIKSQKK